MSTPETLGSTLLHATGSAAHLAQLSARGLTTRAFESETELYASLDLPWIPAETRTGGGEIEAAAAGTLPELIAVSDIRGDLHMHTLYSDGRDSVAEMVAAADALGYEYIAITDHSWSGSGSRAQALANLPRQRDEIAAPARAVSAVWPSCTASRSTSSKTDASISPTTSSRSSTSCWRRCTTPPGTTAIGSRGAASPRSGIRSSTSSAIPPIGWSAVTAATTSTSTPSTPPPPKTGTALEIDGAPSHLDLDGERARAAVAAGVTLTIDSDCHRAEALGRQMQFGVGIGRRGWVEPRHVLNTRPLDELQVFIAAKRRDGPVSNRRPDAAPAAR